MTGGDDGDGTGNVSADDGGREPVDSPAGRDDVWLDDGRSLEIDWSRLLTYGLAVAVLLTVLVGATTSTVAFGLFNPSWDGATDFRDTLEADADAEPVVVRETAAYGDHAPTETTAFVVAPADPYDQAGTDDVASFVDAGGTLVVMDTDGTVGNSLLEGVGAEARFDGRLLRDDRAYDQGPQMPVVTAVGADPLVADVDEVTFNRGTAIETGDDASSTGWNESATDDEPTVLLATSEYASRFAPDADSGLTREGSVDGEPTGPYPVATVESVGDGRVVAVGDPSIAINVMVDRADNEAFLHALAGDGPVLFDRSHGGDLPPLSSAALTIRDSPLLQALVGVGAILGVVAATTARARRLADGLRSRWGTVVTILTRTTTSDARPASTAAETGSHLSPAAQAQYLRSNHPEWDDDLIERAIGKFNTEHDEYIEGDDE